MAETIRVEVVYARPDRQFLIEIEAPANATLEYAIRSSGVLPQATEIDLSNVRVGVFGRVCELDTHLRDGDRVEIYRPLEIDPKEARRLRAAVKSRSRQG